MTTATTVNVQFQLRADTAANWTAANPILLTNEFALETDTKKLKVGDGTTAWASLAYFPSIVTGGTVLGNLEIGSTGTLTFEGATVNDYETTLAVTDPTADRTITLPDVSGTVVTTGDTGSVTSTMLADDTIVNADINASAAIDHSKLATMTAGYVLIGNASNVPTATQVTGDVTISDSGVTAIGSGVIVDADIAANAEIAVSKLANGTVNQVLVTDGTDVSWSDDLTIAGNLTVNGTTTTVNTETLVVEDKNIELGVVGTPTDLTADGGGITLKGTTDKTINWIDATNAWTSSERFSVPLGSDALPSLTFTGDEDTGIYSPDADQLALSTNGEEKARIDSSGRLLVGTSSSRQVTIGESAGWDPRVQVTKTGTDGGNIAAYSWSTYNTSTGGGQGIGPDIVLARSNSNTEGTYTALSAAQLLGRITFNGSNGTSFASGAYIAATADDAWASGDHPTRLVFSVTADGASSPTERMRIGNDGRTSAFSASSTNTLTLSSAAAAGTTFKFLEGAYGATGVSTGTESFRVYTNGDVQNTNNSYGSISDIKLKENIVDANSQWSDIKALQVRNYNFKEGQTHTQIGLIAQEVELVSPGLVTESPDRDAEGNDLGTVTKSVNYSVLYMKAVKALQEAMERIEQLETEMAAVKAQLA